MEGICDLRSSLFVLVAQRAVADAGDANDSGGDDIGTKQDGKCGFDLKKEFAVVW